MRTTIFSNRHYYHVYNRGVDKRSIFQDHEDKQRFLDKLNQCLFDAKGIQHCTMTAYCLMDNHFHLLLMQNTERGISETMRRLGSSHTHFFNHKYKRSGRLFEGPFKVKPIDNDGYLASLVPYIHLNPLSKDRKIETKVQVTAAIREVSAYPWSDYSEYISQNGKLSWLYNDISYIQFLRQNISWRRGEPGSWEPGS